MKSLYRSSARSALGQKQTLSDLSATSALRPKADIAKQSWDVRFVPMSPLCCCAIVLPLNSAKTVTDSLRIAEPINMYAVVDIGVFRLLEHIGRSVVVKFHGQRIRREDVVGDVTAPLSGDVFICGRVGDVCRQYPTRE
jgi:hypothetical protein